MRKIPDVVQEICLRLPETEEIVSHGFPHYRVRGKGYATLSINHHGDGRVALHLYTSHDEQQMLVESSPENFFAPPYIGPSGWVGVHLNKDVSWDRIAQLTRLAYQRAAPMSLACSVEPFTVAPPDTAMTPAEIDPLLTPDNQALIARLREFCLALPEVVEAPQFGHPAFKAGKKTFCTVSHHDGHTRLQCWVGAERQVTLTSFDDRYEIPAYVGHRGWIDLLVSKGHAWEEIEDLLLTSYRHFALKRMTRALD